MVNDGLKIIQVHEDLIKEFNLMKEILENESGYSIRGGNPVISKIVAEILKHRREGKTENIKLEVKKVKGIKKIDVFFL